MEISEEELQELNEQHYLLGEKQLLIRQLRVILRELSPTEDLSKERLILERQETIVALRILCEEFGDNKWDDNLYFTRYYK